MAIISWAMLLLSACLALADIKQHTFNAQQQSNDIDYYSQQFVGSQVFRCRFPSQSQQRRFIQRSLQQDEWDMWHSDPHLLQVDIRLPQTESHQLPGECSLWIADLQALIDQERQPGPLQFAPAAFDSDAYFRDYHSFDAIVNFCESVVSKYGHLVSRYVPSITATHEGRPLPVLHLTSPVGPSVAVNKRQIWINGGIHAREWISSHVAMFLIKQLITGYGKDAVSTRLLDNYEFVFAPHINPDGYEYSRKVNRMWRKNRRVNGDRSYGVDLNRNFDIDWAQGGSSRTPSSETYHGPHAASEPEVSALQRYISTNLTNAIIGIDLHAYGQLIMRPYGNKMTDHPTEARNKRMGDLMRDAVLTENGLRYTSQKSAGLYPVSGGFDDWMTEKCGLIGFTIELRDTGRYGFILPKEQILPTGKEIWRGLPALIESF